MLLDHSPSSNYPTNVRALLGITNGGAVPLMPSVGLHSLDLPYVHAQREMGDQDFDGWGDDDSWIEAELMAGDGQDRGRGEQLLSSSVLPMSSHNTLIGETVSLSPSMEQRDLVERSPTYSSHSASDPLVAQQTQESVEILSTQSGTSLSDPIAPAQTISINIPGFTSTPSSSSTSNSHLQPVGVADDAIQINHSSVDEQTIFQSHKASSEAVPTIDSSRSFSANPPAMHPPQAPAVPGKIAAQSLEAMQREEVRLTPVSGSDFSIHTANTLSEAVTAIDSSRSFSANPPAMHPPQAPAVPGKIAAQSLEPIQREEVRLTPVTGSDFSINTVNTSSETVTAIDSLSSFSANPPTKNAPAMHPPQAPAVPGKIAAQSLEPTQREEVRLTPIPGSDFSINTVNTSSEAVTAIDSPRALQQEEVRLMPVPGSRSRLSEINIAARQNNLSRLVPQQLTTSIQGSEVDFSDINAISGQRTLSPVSSRQLTQLQQPLIQASGATSEAGRAISVEPMRSSFDSHQTRPAIAAGFSEFKSTLEPLLNQFTELRQEREGLRSRASSQQMTAQIEALERQVATLSSQVSAQQSFQQPMAQIAPPPSPPRVIVQAVQSEAPPAFWERSYVSRLSRW